MKDVYWKVDEGRKWLRLTDKECNGKAKGKFYRFEAYGKGEEYKVISGDMRGSMLLTAREAVGCRCR